MKRTRRWPWLLLSGFAVSLTTLTGCQTYFPETGQTLPTGWILNHPPQYIPRSPEYPLPKELSHLEKASVAQPTPPALIPGGP